LSTGGGLLEAGSSALSSSAGVPVGDVADVGGRIVFELCIKMTMDRGKPPFVDDVKIQVRGVRADRS
jgi:hypothetical protein